MPLFSGKRSMKTEESSEKSPAQSLAIALSVSKKRKKMAKGGEVASTESRPSTQTKANDSQMVSRNSEAKPSPSHSFATESRPMPPKGEKTTSLKHPKIMKGGTFSTKLRDQEDHLEELAKPGSPKEQPKEEYDELEPHRQGPKVHPMKMMAEGGEIEQEEMLQPHEEEAIDHAASIAAAIMSKRKMMADGGEVDLDLNSMEQPNGYYEQNEDAALKENFDHMDGTGQPEDSNEHGHEIDSDKHDMVSMIRRRMKMKSAITE